MGSLEQIERVDQLGQWPGEMPVSFLYTVGVAGERFLRELKDKGRFLGSRCPTATTRTCRLASTANAASPS